MKLRVLHCPTAVGGNPPALCREQRALGAESWCVTLQANPYGYAVDEDLWAGRGWLRREVARWKMIRRALRDFDVIHYNFGSGLAPLRSRLGGKGWRTPAAVLRNLLYAVPCELCDVRRAHRRGKVVAVTFQGDDARLGEVARRYPIHFAHEVDAAYYTAETDRHARRRIATFDRYADLVYALNPDLLEVLPERARFQAYCSVNLAEWAPPARPEQRAGPLRVVHAPSHRAVKGTRHVVDAVRRLQGEGMDFEFVLVENLTNAGARRLYETADLAIDQVLAGFYGGLAVELMALEVPVVCYLRDEDVARLPAAMRAELPLIHATPAALSDVLRQWLGRGRSELRAQGRRGREFVRRWHHPPAIARETLDDYAAVWTRKQLAATVGGGTLAETRHYGPRA
jgi:hypothetical protein